MYSGDVIRIPGQNENFIIIVFFDRSKPTETHTEQIELIREITIGRDERNDLVVDDLLVSAFHFTISPVLEGGHALRDLQSEYGTFVNGKRVKQTTLRKHDIIQICSTQFQYDGQQLVEIDLRREGMRLDALDVRKELPAQEGNKVLLNGVSLSVLPREFLAIVGGSGTGKSTLLNALSGFRPAEGEVLLNGAPLYKQFDLFRQAIGYVPQDDIIHRELTVSEALRYAAQFRLPPDTSPEEIEKRIDGVLEQVAMPERRDVPIKRLSGGQRKRVSIAVELIADPSLLFLDEPTSGLDPGLDAKMMYTLRQLAKVSGKTVILVTHATDNISAECDLVAFLAPGGQLAYYGPPQDALDYFEVERFADIYNEVEHNPDHWVEKFITQSEQYKQYISKRINELEESNISHSIVVPETEQSPVQKIWAGTRQLRILTDRYRKIFMRDRGNLLFLILQTPVIALLLFLVSEDGLFGKGMDTTPTDVAEIQKLLFILACVATWFGLINAVREIVKEVPIYRRERLANLSIRAYVGSKIIGMIALAVTQVTMLVGLLQSTVVFPWPGVLLPALVEIYITLLLATVASSGVGLAISSIAQREDRAMSLLPLFLVLQIVFAGIIFELNGVAELLSYFTISRWTVEALGASVNLPELHELASFSGPTAQLPFAFSQTTSYLLQSWGILIGFIVLSLGFIRSVLQRQDRARFK